MGGGAMFAAPARGSMGAACGVRSSLAPDTELSVNGADMIRCSIPSAVRKTEPIPSSERDSVNEYIEQPTDCKQILGQASTCIGLACTIAPPRIGVP